MSLRRSLPAVAVSLAALAAAAPAAHAKTVQGTVVEKSSAKTFVVASSTGKLTEVRGSRKGRVGRSVRVAGTPAAYGVRAARVRVLGARKSARVRGVVTFASAKRFVLDGGEPAVVVERRGRRVHRGQTTTVRVHFRHGELEAERVAEHGCDARGLEVEGVITAKDEAARTITIADDEREDDDDRADDGHGSETAVVHVPASFDLARFTVGQEIEVRVTAADDGTLTLKSVDDDENENEAGDDHDGDHHEAGDDSGSNSGSGSSNSGPGSSNSGPGHGGSDD